MGGPDGALPADRTVCLADLPLEVSGYTLEGLAMGVSSGWERLTTVIRLAGGGCVGLGEDVWTDSDDQRRFVAAGPVLDLAGVWTLDSFSRHLETIGIFPHAPSRLGSDFRRWGFEAAALDLALKQSGRSLGDRARPRAGPGPMGPVACALPSRGPVDRGAGRRAPRGVPGLEFKLDAVEDWDDALIAELLRVAPGRVASLDFKAHYHGTSVDTQPDPGLVSALPGGAARGGHRGPLDRSRDPAPVRGPLGPRELGCADPSGR